MEAFLILLVLVLNTVISWWNAVVAGKAWVETKQLGGFMRMVVWSAAIQSACGFTIVIAVLVALIGKATGFLPPAVAEGVLDLTYLAIIFPILGSGFVITIHSWIVAYRERSLLGMTTAAYNTFAMAHNTYDAFDGIGAAFKGLGDLATSDDDDNPLAGLALAAVIAIVALSLAGGVMLTRGIILHYAGTLPRPERDGVVQAHGAR